MSSATLNTTDWRKPNITVPRLQRIQIAQRAIEKALTNLEGNGLLFEDVYVSAFFYSEMAEFDLLSNGTRYKDLLARYLQLRVGETISSSLIEFGHAAIRAYAAYNDDTFLTLAENWWNRTWSWTVSDSAVAWKTLAGKNGPLPPSCSGHPIVGGTFHILQMPMLGYSLQGDLCFPMNVMASAQYAIHDGSFDREFLMLSSLLAEATSDRTYLDQATRSFTFIQDLLLDMTTVIPQNGIVLNASDTRSCNLNPPPTSVGSGIWIDGLAAISTVADGGSMLDEQLISRSYVAAMSAQSWHSAGSILRVSDKQGHHTDFNLAQGLSMLYQRTGNDQFKSDIEKHLAVQYNAILDLSTTNGSDMYAWDWTGPPPSSFDIAGQVTALAVLVPVIALPGIGSTSDSSPTPNSTPSSSKKTPVGRIVGGVVGGILVLAVLIVLFLVRRHRGKVLPQAQESIDGAQGFHIELFTEPKRFTAGLGSAQSLSAQRGRQDDQQLLRQMGATLSRLKQRLARVEGISTVETETDPPPEYPGSVRG
ncbi:hypothetical protein V5O48_010869 [Marasmius crinis-equi]|uniref:Glycoside hydrolase family 76 protein n=1 Tax=Marasmius crinis-equi TaxID=585013 RepID=A0ABR3F760_9AGAR